MIPALSWGGLLAAWVYGLVVGGGWTAGAWLVGRVLR